MLFFLLVASRTPYSKNRTILGVADILQFRIQKMHVYLNPKIHIIEAKIGGFETPQNGWFISWKTLLKWMIGGFSPYVWKKKHV